MMVGGVAAAAAVRTFPFRVFSFPKEIKTYNQGLDLFGASSIGSNRPMRVPGRLFAVSGNEKLEVGQLVSIYDADGSLAVEVLRITKIEGRSIHFDRVE